MWRTDSIFSGINGIFLCTCAVLSVALTWFIEPPRTACAYTESDAVQVQLVVMGCNNNGICEAIQGEDVATCPLDCTPPTPTTTPSQQGNDRQGRSGQQRNIVVTNLITGVTETEIRVTFQTEPATLATVSWGKTIDREEGSGSENAYGTLHTIGLTNLTPGTVYYVLINLRTVDGRVAVIGTLRLQTRPIEIIPLVPPTPLFTLSPTSETTVDLQWINPPSQEFDYIRVIRNDIRMPRDAADGFVVYEGREEYFRDSRLTPDKRYFYAVFVRSREGLYSEAVIGQVTPQFGQQDIRSDVDRRAWYDYVTPLFGLAVKNFIWLILLALLILFFATRRRKAE